VVLDQQ